MQREEFDKLVEKTTDLTLDRLSEAVYADPGASSSVDAWSSVRL